MGNLISNLEEGELDPFREGNDCSVSAEWDEALESESELGTEYLRKYSEDLRAIENEEDPVQRVVRPASDIFLASEAAANDLHPQGGRSKPQPGRQRVAA